MEGQCKSEMSQDACQSVVILFFYYYGNFLYAQCQCFMIESEASLNLFKGDSEKVSFEISLKGVEGR